MSLTLRPDVQFLMPETKFQNSTSPLPAIFDADVCMCARDKTNCQEGKAFRWHATPVANDLLKSVVVNFGNNVINRCKV